MFTMRIVIDSFTALLHDIHNKIKGFKQKHRRKKYTNNKKTFKKVNKNKCKI